jgi:transcriptional accessory protein Tex/SPT6
MYRLKHYKGLLNLERFTRIEKHEKERYDIKTKKVTGASTLTAENVTIPQIIFYTPEGYGGLQTSIDYDDVAKRDEDFELIISLICQNKSQNFDIIKEQQIIAENYKKLTEQAEEFKETVETVKTYMDKIKIKLK